MRGGIRLLGERLSRELQRPFDKRAMVGHRAQWCLLAGPCSAAARAQPSPAALGLIEPPPERFWADPFVHRHAGRTVVFFEDYPFAAGRGHISAMEIDGDGRPLKAPTPVLCAAHHLSYPFLFEYDDELFMLPESSTAKRLDVYRCSRFPDRWDHVATWLEGVSIADATLLHHDGRWWLLGALRDGGLRANDNLCAFYASDPFAGPWTPHPNNPLLRSYRGSRPAGALFRDGDGRLLRPAQCCVPRYGYGIHLNEVLELTPTRYRERKVWHTTGPRAGGWRALHHMHWAAGVLVMDALRWIEDTQTR